MFAPPSAGDLDAWNNGQNANITISNLTVKGTSSMSGTVSIGGSGLSVFTNGAAFQNNTGGSMAMFGSTQKDLTNATFAAWTNLAGLTGSTTTYLRSDGTQASPGGTVTPPASYSVAGLPSAVSQNGAQVWCSDCLTPWGSGSLAYSDGSVWRLIASKIQAAADVPTFLRYAYAAAWSGTSTLLVSRFNDEVNGDGGATMVSDPGMIWQATGGAFATVSATAGKSLLIYTINANPSTALFSGPPYLPSAGDYVLFSSSVALPSTLPNGTDDYYMWSGIGTGITAATGNDIAGFLYDPTKASPAGGGITATANWNCVTGRGGVFETTDSGIPATNSVYITLTGVMNSLTNVVFYINGTAVATNSTASKTPNAVIRMQRFGFVKTNGAGTRQAGYDWAAYYKYLANPRTFQ